MNLEVSSIDSYENDKGTTMSSNQEFLEHILDEKNQTDDFYKIGKAFKLLKKGAKAGAKGASKASKRAGRGAKFKKAFAKVKGKVGSMGGGGGSSMGGGSSRVDSSGDGEAEVGSPIIKGIDNKMLFIGGGVMLMFFMLMMVMMSVNKK